MLLLDHTLSLRHLQLITTSLYGKYVLTEGAPTFSKSEGNICLSPPWGESWKCTCGEILSDTKTDSADVWTSGSKVFCVYQCDSPLMVVKWGMPLSYFTCDSCGLWSKWAGTWVVEETIWVWLEYHNLREVSLDLINSLKTKHWSWWGPSQEHLTLLDVLRLTWITGFCNIAWQLGTVPLEWQTGVIVPVLKKALPKKVCFRVLEGMILLILDENSGESTGVKFQFLRAVKVPFLASWSRQSVADRARVFEKLVIILNQQFDCPTLSGAWGFVEVYPTSPQVFMKVERRW